MRKPRAWMASRGQRSPGDAFLEDSPTILAAKGTAAGKKEREREKEIPEMPDEEA